jgi:hypothetical protein
MIRHELVFQEFTHIMCQALAQGDAQAVKTYGDSFENEIRTFRQQYGGVRRHTSSIDAFIFMTSAHTCRVAGHVVLSCGWVWTLLRAGGASQ